MGAPDVITIFASGGGGGQTPAGAQLDAIIGTCSLGRVGTAYSISDVSDDDTAELGYGPAAEELGQIGALVTTTTVVVPGFITAGTIGGVNASRVGAPTLTPDSLLGNPLYPLAPSSNNTGNGLVTFASTSVPEIRGAEAAAYTSIEVDITGAGGPGVATMTVKVGGVTVATGVVVPSSNYTVPDPVSGNTSMVLTFGVPTGGSYQVGDVFTAVPTVNDGYNVAVQILNVAQNGIVQFQVSLAGGAPGSYGNVQNATLGGNITPGGLTQPVVSLALTPVPTQMHTVAIAFTLKGTASGPAAQVGTPVGLLVNTANPGSSHGTAEITTPASGQTVLVTVAITGTGTAAGSASSAAPTTGTGTAAGSVTVNGVTSTFAANFPATYTDTATGVVVTFNTATNNLTNGDAFTNAGVLPNNNASGDGSLAVAAVTTAQTNGTVAPSNKVGWLLNSVTPLGAHGLVKLSTAPASGTPMVSFVCTGTGTAATAATSASPATGTGTATGILTIGTNTWNFNVDGGGSGGGGVPSTFTDATTGVVVTFTTATHNLTSGDAYTNTGTLPNNNASTDNSSAVLAVTVGNKTAAPVAVSFQCTGAGTAATAATSGAPTTGTGTATGILTIGTNTWNFNVDGGGSGGGGVPSKFTDATTGIVVTFSTTGAAALGLEANDVYGPLTCAPASALNISFTCNGAGTAAGTATALAPGTGTGTGGGTLAIGPNFYFFAAGTLPQVFTEALTGTAITFASGQDATGFEATDVYGGAEQAIAQFQYVLDAGSAVAAQTIPPTGLYTGLNAGAGVNVQFAHTNADLYTYDGTPADTSTYGFTVYPPYPFYVNEATGISPSTGLVLQFGFGAYQVGDLFTFQCTPPSINQGNVLTALATLFAAKGVQFSRIGIISNPANFAAMQALCAAVNSFLDTQAQSPYWKFKTAVVFGPQQTSATPGSTPNDFINAFGTVSYDRIAEVCCGCDMITSALTGRTELRNSGYSIFARNVQVSLATDPGYVALGPLNNVQSTTTPVQDANTFFDNRGTCNLTREGLDGVYCAGGISLAPVGNLYQVSTYMWVRDQLGGLTRVANLQYINGGVPTVTNAKTGVVTLQPAAAQTMNNQVGTYCTSQMVSVPNPTAQSVTITYNTTAPIGGPNPNLPVTSSAEVFDVIRNITNTVSITQ